ncbi:MAG: flagellar filament capping protein FliD, partial [Propionivibrio sp.]
MTVPGIADTLLGLVQTGNANAGVRSSQRDAGTGADFASSLALRLAEFQTQSFNSLLGSLLGGTPKSSPLDFLAETMNLPGSANAAPGLSASGRNLSLFDPESAYKMMSVINTRDVTYKAQFAELTAMTATVGDLKQAGEALGTISAATDNAAIRTQLQTFVGQYNAWIERFDGSMQGKGLLRGTQAAEVSLYELEQSVENIFNGASNGLHGMRDVGLSIDQTTNLAALDISRLDASLAGNRSGVIATIDEFSANFARSAELLVSSNNFLPN